MTSIFDPDTFGNEEQEELSTERVAIPLGVHEAFIEALSFAHGTSEKTGEAWQRADVKFSITEASVLAEMERDKVSLTEGYMLEIDEATGRLASGKGKNYKLGQLRAAVGKSKGPLNDIVGCRCLIEVKARIYEGKPREYIASVASI